jgi:RNA polymerase-binding transcription factor DksA
MANKTTKDLFSKAFIKEITEKLLAIKEDLEKKLGQFTGKKSDDGQPDSTYPEYGDDEDDSVHEIEEFIVNKSVKTSYEKELRDVKNALKRIEEGTYGICKYTGEKIDEKRLLARPTSNSSAAVKKVFKP